MNSLAQTLATWAVEFEPSAGDLELAERSLKDTLAVAHAARHHPLRHLFDQLGEAGRYAAQAHVLDFDDLHMASTTHISAVCVPVAIAAGGDARAYLAGAGVMARLGTALGWQHYTVGWHATCTAGAPAAAVTAAIARELSAEQTARAMALAVPAAGGLQRAFGTAAKALQVGFAADAGLRAAALADAGATVDPTVLDEWIRLVDGMVDESEGVVRGPLDGSIGPMSRMPDELSLGAQSGAMAWQGPADFAGETGAAVPGGLAIKLYPCCYALQRPISALVDLGPVPLEEIRSIRVTTPASSLKPLIHHRPQTGLEGKFSLEYGIAATLLDGRPDLQSFTDQAVRRPEAQRLLGLVRVHAEEGGDGLLAGEVRIEVDVGTGHPLGTSLKLPPGAPDRPPSDEELARKLEACSGPATDELAAVSWDTARSIAV